MLSGSHFGLVLLSNFEKSIFLPKISLQKPQKRPNFEAGTKLLNALYVGDCVAHDRYRWDYDASTGHVTNWNRKWIVPHCITIPDATVSKAKQQLYLAPCEEGNANQDWVMDKGMMKVRSNTDVCVMWNLLDKTRLWSFPCGEHLFAPLE